MNNTKHFNLDLLKIRNALPPKLLLGTDSMSATGGEYSYSSVTVALYDSHELNYIQCLEIQTDFFILKKNESFDENVNTSIFLRIPFNDLVSTDTRIAEKLARLYAARLQIELIKESTELFSLEEAAHVENSLSKINLEPITSWDAGPNFPILSAIDHITSENHKSYFALLSEIASKIIPEAC